MPPVIVVEGSDAAFAQALAEVRAAGWRASPGFAPPFAPVPGELRFGTVESPADAADALLAVLGGAGLVAHGLAARDVLDRLLDDLRHVAPVEHRLAPAEEAPQLDPEARAILKRLAGGETLGAAAAGLGLSRRTADRRLAEARRTLGVERTVEAIARARLQGWLG